MRKQIVLIFTIITLIITSGTYVNVQKIGENAPSPISIPTITTIPTLTLTPTSIPTGIPTVGMQIAEETPPANYIPRYTVYECEEIASDTKPNNFSTSKLEALTGVKPTEPVGTTCITRDTPLQEAIVRTIYMEGGTAKFFIAVDILQVLDNTMRNAWDCWSFTPCSQEWSDINSSHVPYSETTRDIRERLAVYILSRPYESQGHSYPAWNGWALPMPNFIAEYQRSEFKALDDMVGEWLDNPDQEIHLVYDEYYFVPAEVLERNRGIMYFYSGSGIGSASEIPHLEQTAKYVYRFERNGKRINIY